MFTILSFSIWVFFFFFGFADFLNHSFNKADHVEEAESLIMSNIVRTTNEVLNMKRDQAVIKLGQRNKNMIT